jgi:hypothetical protein
MKELLIKIAVSLTVASLCSCGDHNVETELNAAAALAIGYSFRDEIKPRQLEVTDARQVADILASIKVKEVKRNAASKKSDFAYVELTMPDKSTVKMVFIEPDWVDVRVWGSTRNWGLIKLSDRGFYDKLNEVVSKAEGRKIDILTVYWEQPEKQKP